MRSLSWSELLSRPNWQNCMCLSHVLLKIPVKSFIVLFLGRQHLQPKILKRHGLHNWETQNRRGNKWSNSAGSACRSTPLHLKTLRKRYPMDTGWVHMTTDNGQEQVSSLLWQSTTRNFSSSISHHYPPERKPHPTSGTKPWTKKHVFVPIITIITNLTIF